ncbi:hypothetical protein RclHR1_01440015 [Rhizophagus clarus]|uniref:Potential zinc finger protein n=2 Tax=Rhizophagus TaxID=1129544 RepID=A0A2Z6QCG9_9GLOM|nr:hypothetical protein RclHR1_01440015 [Rhizophagus clarus]GES78291.1 potential zinc finger protein [Rhizophagus clarus]
MATTQYVRRKGDIEELNAINDDNLEAAMPISIRQPNPQLVPIRPPSLKPESSRLKVSKIMRHANFSTVPPRSNLTKFHNSDFQEEFNRATTGSYVKLETKNFSHGVNKSSQITSGTVSAVIPPAVVPTVTPSIISSTTPAVSQSITLTTAIKIENTGKIIDKSKFSVDSKPSPMDESANELNVVKTENDVPNGEITKKLKLENGLEILSSSGQEPENQKKRFACPICNRCFARKFNMQTHQTTHDVDRVKPFVCNYPDCDHSFTRKHDLKRHIYGIHELPEQEFKCSNCSKTFARKDACKRHSYTCRVVEVNQDQDGGSPPRKRARTKINNVKKPNIKNLSINESANESTQNEQQDPNIVSANYTADNNEEKTSTNILETLENKSIFSNITTDITLLDHLDTMKKSTNSIIEDSSLDIDNSSVSLTIEAINDLIGERMPKKSIDQTYDENDG